MAKLSSGKTLMVRVQNFHSQENFRGSILVTYIANRQGHNSWENIRN